MDMSKVKPSDFNLWCPVCGRGCLIGIGDRNDTDYYIVCAGCGCVMASEDICKELVKKSDWIQNEHFADMIDAGILVKSFLYPPKGKTVLMNMIYHNYNGYLFITSFYAKDDEGEGMVSPGSVWRGLQGCIKKLTPLDK